MTINREKQTWGCSPGFFCFHCPALSWTPPLLTTSGELRLGPPVRVTHFQSPWLSHGSVRDRLVSQCVCERERDRGRNNELERQREGQREGRGERQT